jgi:hypothetical protein
MYRRGTLPSLEFGDEEDFATFADRLEVGGLVDCAVDRDGGFFDEMLAEAGVEAVHFLDDAAQVLGLDRELALAAGVAAAEPAGERNPRGHYNASLWLYPHRPSPSGLVPPLARRGRGLNACNQIAPLLHRGERTRAERGG